MPVNNIWFIITISWNNVP